MKHAGTAALDGIEPMLELIRRVPGLSERSRGTFYKHSKAFLHFHEDPTGMHADIRLADDFERYRVETQAEQDVLVELVRSSVTTAITRGAGREG